MGSAYHYVLHFVLVGLLERLIELRGLGEESFYSFVIVQGQGAMRSHLLAIAVFLFAFDCSRGYAQTGTLCMQPREPFFNSFVWQDGPEPHLPKLKQILDSYVQEVSKDTAQVLSSRLWRFKTSVSGELKSGETTQAPLRSLVVATSEWRGADFRARIVVEADGIARNRFDERCTTWTKPTALKFSLGDPKRSNAHMRSQLNQFARISRSEAIVARPSLTPKVIFHGKREVVGFRMPDLDPWLRVVLYDIEVPIRGDGKNKTMRSAEVEIVRGSSQNLEAFRSSKLEGMHREILSSFEAIPGVRRGSSIWLEAVSLTPSAEPHKQSSRSRVGLLLIVLGFLMMCVILWLALRRMSAANPGARN